MKITKRRKVWMQHRRFSSYDKWFRTKVQEALDDPRPSIPHWKVAKLLRQKKQAVLLDCSGVVGCQVIGKAV